MLKEKNTTRARSVKRSNKSDSLTAPIGLDPIAASQPSDFERLMEKAATHSDGQTALIAGYMAELLVAPPNESRPIPTDAPEEGLLQTQILRPDSKDDRMIEPIPSAGSPTGIQGFAGTNDLANDEELIREFITESTEHLLSIENQTLDLEKDSSATENLHAIFRAFHTIKGLAGFLEFGKIQALTHEVETLLDLARNSQLTVTPVVVDVVLESTDVVRHELSGIELRLAGKTPPPTKVDEVLLQRIREVSRGKTGQTQDEEYPAEPRSVEAAAPSNGTSQASPAPLAAPPAEIARPADSNSVRIETAKLDQLMDMVGEMVIAQTLVGHNPALVGLQDPRLLRDMMQLARITAHVQRVATDMRMVPIGTQFQKTARLIRDLSRKANKRIALHTSGEDTELDKTIAEELSDPLLHMVRNSIDHGIETPAERVALGKNPTAQIRIAAYHQSGQIVVEISDDGRGLNREKILSKAHQNGLIHSGAQLSDNEILQLIFEPGFSTAEKVTDISGRGVGMDVVRKHVQKLRGRIDIHSTPGEGTTFFLRLPLTLAIIEGLVVVAGNQRYIAPIFSVKEMFRPTQEMLSTVQGECEMALVHGALLPIVRLHRRFNIEPLHCNLWEGILVVAESQGKQFCLFVDDLVGKHEVVIKSLGQHFRNVLGVAGCAILGDGRVGLILDMDGIYKGRA